MLFQEEVTKNEESQGKGKEEHVGEDMMEAEEVVPKNQGYSPVKSHNESEDEDLYDKWSHYRSDYDVF